MAPIKDLLKNMSAAAQQAASVVRPNKPLPDGAERFGGQEFMDKMIPKLRLPATVAFKKRLAEILTIPAQLKSYCTGSSAVDILRVAAITDKPFARQLMDAHQSGGLKELASRPFFRAMRDNAAVPDCPDELLADFAESYALQAFYDTVKQRS